MTAVNDLPTIGTIADQTSAGGAAVGPLSVTVGDVETAVGTLTMSALSSNTALVPVGNIVFGGAGAARTVTVTPASGSGTSTITIVVTDSNSGTASEVFLMTVTAGGQATTTALTSPTANPTTYGQPVTLNALVSVAGGGSTPTGSVEFFDGAASLGLVAMSGGAASLATAAINVATPGVTAVYRPTGAYTASTSAVLPRTVNKAAATSTLMFSKSPQQYSDLETFEATMTTTVTVAAMAGNVTFKVGTLVVGTAPLVREGAAYKARLTVPLVDTTPATGQMLPTQPTGRLATAMMDAPNYTVANATRALVITKEDATAEYDGTLLAWTPSASSGVATVTLHATVKDITVVDAVTDPNRGDIAQATVTFYNRETGVTLGSAVPVTLVSPGVGEATFSWTTPDIGAAVNAQTFRVGIMVNGYYTRNAMMEDALVTVAKPIASGFMGGGGELVMSASGGLAPGTAGTANEFGFGVKYTGTGASPTGSFATIVRSGASIYHVKSTTLTSLVVTGNSAVLKGTATIYNITTGSVVVDSAATFEVTLTDLNEVAPSTDTTAVTVKNSAGQVWFSSNWNSGTSKTNAQQLSYGNVKIVP